MRIYLIDLGGAPHDNLQDYLGKHELVSEGDQYDVVVIAGSYEIDGPQPELADPDNTKPVICVGSGFEIACGLAGQHIAQIFELAAGSSRLVPTDDGAKLFQGTDPLVVKESKRWLVDELPKSMQVLARSESGIEAFRHKQRPLLALQQLPEDFVYPSDAKLVYGNLFGLFDRM